MEAIRSQHSWKLLLCLLLTISIGQFPSAAQSVSFAESSATGSLDANTRAFRTHILSLFYAGSYSELDTIADQLRSQKLRFKGGAWQLNALYGDISSPGYTTATDAAWQAHINRLQQWIEESPTSPTPRVALAQTYLRFAWKARGNGLGNTVTPEGWALFHERVQSALTVLGDAARFSTGDPQWYREMQVVALAQGWKRPQVDALARQAMANEPGYSYFALAQANYLLPKWYGHPGETEHYAEEVANTVGGAEGDAIYFQIAAALNCCHKTQAPALSWSRVRRGFAALDQLYGTTNRQRNAMAYLALRAGDTQTAQTMFAQIGNDWEWHAWKSKAFFDASRTGQPVGNIQPLRADAKDPDAANPLLP